MSAPLGFLDLPAETRLVVYDYISSDSSSIVNQPLPAAAAMLRTCKTVHDELLVSLFSSKLVVLDGHANPRGAKDPEACQQPNKALSQLSPAARESVKDVSYKLFAWPYDSLVGYPKRIDLELQELQNVFDQLPNMRTMRLDFDYSPYASFYEWLDTLWYLGMLVSDKNHGGADKVRLRFHKSNLGMVRNTGMVQSVQRTMDKVLNWRNVHVLKLPARLHTIDVFSPASVCPEARGHCRVPLGLSHGLITSLQLPRKQVLTKTSGAIGDDRWVYELTSLEHKSGQEELKTQASS